MELPAGTNFATKMIDTDDFLRRVATGQAVLFLGSGYARNAINIASQEMPTAYALAHELCAIPPMALDDDLRYVADRVIAEGFEDQVVATLKNTFTVKEVKPHQVEIAKVSWRRVYTTNYDLVFETAAAQAGRLVNTVGIDTLPAQAIKNGNICVHLNGSIKNIDVNSLNSEVKLSNSSYIAPDSFVTSRWNYPFRQDLERATAIVFIGYSLYDIEVQKILFDNQEFKEKTFFITKSDVDEKNKFIMGRFGSILPIGAEGVADLFATKLPAFAEAAAPLYTTALARYEASPSSEEVRDAEVERFLLHGDMKSGHIDVAVTGPHGAPFLVNRKEIDQVKGFALAGKNVVITSDFGNGKSVFLRAILSSLALDGYEVYELLDLDGDYLGDYEKIDKSGKKIVVVDSYTRSIDLVNHHVDFGSGSVVLILLARASDHERARRQLKDIQFDYVEANLDVLSASEASDLVGVIDNVGMWGDDAGLAEHQKIARITQDARGHISEVLLTLFDAPQIKERVQKLLGPVLADDRWRDTVFAICVLEFLSLPLDSSLISRVALNDEIFNANFRNEEGFRAVYLMDGGKVRSKSSVFGLALIRSNFSASYIVSQLLRIVESIGVDRGEVREIREIFKSLLRFSFVERLLPERNRKDNLVKYYESLKRSVDWLAREPHYWVQYAMALLTFSEFDRAQGLLDQAYALAAKRPDYHTNNIDTQQARLYILRCLASVDGAEAARQFSSGHNLLRKVPNDVGKFRQLERYHDVFKQKFPIFSIKAKVEFEHACKAVLDDVASAVAASGLNSSRAEWLASGVLAAMQRILDEIRDSRGAKN